MKSGHSPFALALIFIITAGCRTVPDQTTQPASAAPHKTSATEPAPILPADFSAS